MSSEDPLESIAAGATKGFLKYSAEYIRGLVTKLKNKELAFIEDLETIDTAKEQRTTSEWEIFAKYIENENFRILFQMGLTLRKLEKANKTPQMDNLKRKILNKYDTKGLHAAQAVQNGIFSKYLGSVLELGSTPQKLKFEIENLFANIDKTVIFIRSQDNIELKTDEIVAKILANSPKTFVISSSGSANMICDTIRSKVLTKISNYTCEFYDALNKRVYFLNRKEDTDI